MVLHTIRSSCLYRKIKISETDYAKPWIPDLRAPLLADGGVYRLREVGRILLKEAFDKRGNRNNSNKKIEIFIISNQLSLGALKSICNVFYSLQIINIY